MQQIKEMILDGQFNAGIDKTLLAHISQSDKVINACMHIYI